MKRGIRARLDGGWAGVGYIIICLLPLLFLITCATLDKVGISLKAPTTQILIKDATFLAGYEIGKGNPTLAKEFIKHTKVGKEDILTLFPSWKRYLSDRLKDPVHRRLVIAMLDLVELDLKLKPDQEKVIIIRELFREFIKGLEIGISSETAKRSCLNL